MMPVTLNKAYYDGSKKRYENFLNKIKKDANLLNTTPQNKKIDEKVREENMEYMTTDNRTLRLKSMHDGFLNKIKNNAKGTQSS